MTEIVGSRRAEDRMSMAHKGRRAVGATLLVLAAIAIPVFSPVVPAAMAWAKGVLLSAQGVVLLGNAMIFLMVAIAVGGVSVAAFCRDENGRIFGRDLRAIEVLLMCGCIVIGLGFPTAFVVGMGQGMVEAAARIR